MFAVAPRTGIERKSGTVDFPDRYDRVMVNWKDSLMRQARDELESYTEFHQTSTYIDLLEGRVWPKNRPVWKSDFYDNYLADQRRESLSSLSQVRPAIEIYSKVPAYKDQAKTAHGYTRYLWDEYSLDLKIVSWLDHALFGTGFMKIVTTEDEPDRAWMFGPAGLDSVLPIQCNDDIQDSAAVVYRGYKRLPYFISKFGADKCVDLEREAVQFTSRVDRAGYQKPADIPQYRWDALSPQLQRRVAMRSGPGVPIPYDNKPFPIIEHLEIYTDDWSINETDHPVLVKHPDLHVEEHNYHYIVPPGHRLFPRKRLTVFAGNRVMYDGPSPFWHGEYPFIMLQLNPCVWAPGGISKYRDLVPLCRAINRIVAGVDDSVIQALNRSLIGKKGAVPEAVWDAFIPGKPNQKMLVNPVYQKGDVSWMDPPIVPPYVGEFLRYLVDDLKKRAGSIDIQGLARKKQVPGGDAIEQMRDTMSSPFQLEGRYLEVAMKKAGKQIVSNIFQFATLSSRLKVLGSDGMTYEDFDYNAGSMVPASAPREDHWRKFGVHIAPGSTHGSSKQQKRIEAFTLRQTGNLSMKGLYTLADVQYPYEQAIHELSEEHQAGIGVAPQKGRTPRQNRSQRQGNPV